MKLLRIVALLLCAAPVSCKSPSPSYADLPCTCGQAAADFEGCTHPKCAKGERNPDNPDCVCGSLSIPK
jgi:hypothetical protein